MKFLLIMALAAQAPAPDSNCPESPTQLGGAALIVCSVEEARKLEPSGETAGDIADAVVSVCQPMVGKVLTMMRRCRNVSIPADRFNETIRRRALREVVEIRANPGASRP